MTCARTLGFAVISFTSLVSCSGASDGSTPAPIQTPPAIVTRSFTFPAGDAVASEGDGVGYHRTQDDATWVGK